MMQAMLWLLSLIELLLGFTLSQPWLYVAGAGLLLILLLVALVGWLRRRRREKQSLFIPPPPASPEEELKSLGILEIRARPRSRSPAAEPAEKSSPASAVSASEGSPPVDVPEPSTPREEQPSKPSQTPEAAAEQDPVLTPCLEALRAALEAQTVALLVQEDVSLEYRVLGISSVVSGVSAGQTFTAPVPLLAPSMVDRPVTVREVCDELYEALGYYTDVPPQVAELALAPIPFTREGALYFLVADAPESGRFDRLSASTLLVEFGRLLATVLELQQSRREAEARAYRPRREIIAEEMTRARRLGEPLALALVHLNRADAIATEGPVALAAAEQALKAALQESAPDQRIERFGELTYGVFYRAPVPEVEAWAARLQAQLAKAGGWLEGGVSIGVAVLQERHQTPEQFRADATEALREAYESGTCTILE
ncbi:hypothetical protein [Rhodothermus profundi]|nr:hypothetical protein [Rhodothermus profundi]